MLVQQENDSWSLEFPLCAGETVVEVVLASDDNTANPQEQVDLSGRNGASRDSRSVQITLNAETVMTGEFSPDLKVDYSVGTLDPAQTSFTIETSSGYTIGVRISKLAADLPVIVSGTRVVESADGYDRSTYCEE